MNEEQDGGEHAWTVAGLRRVIYAILEERDRRYEQRFADQTTAIHKQEAAIEKRFESVNELRGAMEDAAKMFMPRSESNARYDALLHKIEDHQKQDLQLHQSISERLDAMSHRIDLREGEQMGGRESKSDTRASLSLLISVVVAILVITSFVLTHVK